MEEKESTKGRKGGEEGREEREGGRVHTYFAVCHELGQVDDVRGRQLIRLVGRGVDDAQGLQVLGGGGREGGKEGGRNECEEKEEMKAGGEREEGGREGGREMTYLEFLALGQLHGQGNALVGADLGREGGKEGRREGEGVR